MASRRVLFLVLLIRFVCFLWELLVLPLYVILFRPFASLIARRRIKARCLTTNPAGPWRCIELPPPNPENPSSGLLATTHDGVDSLYELFLRSASRCAERPCFGSRVILNEITEYQADGRPFKKFKCGPYEWRKYREVAAQVASLSSGLRSIGLKTTNRIVIFCETRAEWMLTALAALSNNVTVVTLYATLGEQGILHGIRESEVKFMMTSMDLLPKLQRMLPELSAAGLETIVFAPTPAPRLQPGESGGESAAPKLDKFNTYTVEQLLRLGETNPAGANSRPSRDDLAFIVYTSGTTGASASNAMLPHATCQPFANLSFTFTFAFTLSLSYSR